MLSFSVEFKPGIPVYEQVVFAVKKAMVEGKLKAGERFPSVRDISRELKINPNTAQKVISQLVREKLLSIEPGRGSVVCELPQGSGEQFDEILKPIIEQLVIEARRLSINQADVIKVLQKFWTTKKGGRAS